MENSMNAICLPVKTEEEAASSKGLSSMVPESQFPSNIVSAPDPSLPNFAASSEEILATQEAVAPQESSATEEVTRSPTGPKNSTVEAVDVACNPLTHSHHIHQIESVDAQPFSAQENLTHEELLAVDGWHALPLSEEQITSTLNPISLTSSVEPISLPLSGEGGELSDVLAEERPQVINGTDWGVSEGLAPPFESIAVDESIGVNSDVVRIEAGDGVTNASDVTLMQATDERENPDVGSGGSHEYVSLANSAAVVGSPAALLRETEVSDTTTYSSNSLEFANIKASEDNLSAEGSQGVGSIQTEAFERLKESCEIANTRLSDTGDNERAAAGKEMKQLGLPSNEVVNDTGDTLLTCAKGKADEEVAVTLSLRHTKDDAVNDTSQEIGVDTEMKIVEGIDPLLDGLNPIFNDSTGVNKFQEAAFELKGAESKRETEAEKDSTICSAVFTTGASEELKSEEDAIYANTQSQDIDMNEEDTEMPSQKSEDGLEMEQTELHMDLQLDSEMLPGDDVSPEQQQQPRKRGRKPGKKSARLVAKDANELVQEIEPEKDMGDSPSKNPAENEQKRELRKRGRRASTSKAVQKEEEDVCFVCFDGGKLILCDKRTCPKAYHVECTGRESEFFERRGQWFCGWHVCSQCSRPAKLNCYLCPSALCSNCMKGANFWCIRKSRGLCEGCYPLVHMIEHNKTISGEAVQADFNDKETYEGLFKEYWEELKLKNSLTSMEFAKACKAKEAGVVPVDGGTNTEQEETIVEEDEGSTDSEDRPPTLRHARLMKRKRLTRHSMVEDVSASEFEEDGSDDEVKLESTPRKGRTRVPEFDGWVSKDLAEVIKSLKEDPKKKLPLFGVKKLLWRYVDENKLSDPRRRGQIVCDERLQKLFGKKSVGRFEMMKLLSLHVASPDKSIMPKFRELEHGDNDTLDPDDSDENQLGKKKTRRKVDDNKRLKVHPSDYAAINVKNINLIYLKRSVLDELRNDPELESKAMGAFVRIRVPGTANKNDACYRLVQVVGVKQIYDAHDPEKVTDVILEILNLHKREEITADLVSNQDLVEEECLRLRQSVRCGFIKAMRVGELEERARALREAKVKDWRENELLRLSHLRDRASEKGRKKELRECVEKLQLLNTPEERERRLKAPFDIDADPHMDPDYESDDEEVPADDGQGEFTASQSLRETGFSARFPDRGNSSGIAEKHDSYRDSGNLLEPPSQDTHSKWFAWGSKDLGHEDNAKPRVEMQGLNSSSHSPIDRSSILGQGKPNWGDGARAREQAVGWNSGSFGRKEVRWTGSVRGNAQSSTGWRKNEGVDAVPKFPPSQEVSAELALGPVLSPIHMSGTTPGSLAGAPAVPMSNTATVVVDSEKEKVWCYQDPTRTVQGPFAMEQLRKWEKTNLFPLDLRIWRVTESQDASILLSDALAGRFSGRGSLGVPQKSNISNLPLSPMQGTHANGFPVATAQRPTPTNLSMGPTVGPMDGNVASGSAQGILANPMVISQRPNAQSFPLNPMQGLNAHGLPPGPLQGPNAHGFPSGAVHAPSAHGFPPGPGQGPNVHSFAPVPNQGPYVNNFVGAPTQGAAFNTPMQGPNVTGYPPNFTQGPNALPGQSQANVVMPGQPQAPVVFPAQMQAPNVLSGHMQGPHFSNAPLGHAQGAHVNNFPMGATPGPVNNNLPQMGQVVTHGHPGRDFRNVAMPNRPPNEWQEVGRRPVPDQHFAGPASQGMGGSDAGAIVIPTRNPWRGQGRGGPRHENREAQNRGHFSQGQDSRGSDHFQGSEGRFVPKSELFCRYFSRGTCRRGPACDYRHQ